MIGVHQNNWQIFNQMWVVFVAQWKSWNKTVGQLLVGQEIVEHVYFECPTIIRFAKEYFEEYFLLGTNIIFDHSWLFIGAPTYLSENLIYVINIEICFLNYFVYKSRFKKRRPIVRDLKQFLFWNRKIALKNKKYKLSFQKLQIPFDNG